MKYAPWAVAALILFGSLWFVDRADSRTDQAEGRVAVFDSLRLIAEGRARADSAALEVARAGFAADTLRLASERSRARQEVVRTQRATQQASDDLRATLDVQQAVLLDSLEAAHEGEVLALELLVAVADSITGVERSLRVATESALASERVARLSDAPLIGALREEIGALKSARRWDRFRMGGIAVAGVAALLVFR